MPLASSILTRQQSERLPGAARPLYADVADNLRRRILQQQLQPGSWIDEQKLAEEMGISRTPMREAIKVLAAEGLVTIRVRRGAYVTEVPENEVREIYHLLALLEADAAADVARQASNSELQELAGLHQQLHQLAALLADAPTDSALIDQFFALNQQFHGRMLEISGNHWRMQIVNDLRGVMQLGRHHSLFKTGRVQQSLEEHSAILAALVARDASAASAAVHTHFTNGLLAAG